MNFYALYSKSSKTYSSPFLAYDDHEAIDVIAKTVTRQSDQALIMSLNDLSIDQVGTFTPGAAAPLATVVSRIVCDNLHETLPLPPLARSLVDRLFKKEVSNDPE